MWEGSIEVKIGKKGPRKKKQKNQSLTTQNNDYNIMLINRGRGGGGWIKAAHPMYKTTSWWTCEGWFTLTHNSYVQDIMGCFRLQTVCNPNYQLFGQASKTRQVGKFEAIFPISKILLSFFKWPQITLIKLQPEQ